MRKAILIFLVFAGVATIISCEKELRDPKLDMNQTVKPGISEPAGGTAFVLTSETADEVMTTFKWSATQFNLGNLETTNYTLQLDSVGKNFSDPYDLVTTTELEHSISVGAMNDILLVKLGYAADAMHDLEFRVVSFITDVPVTETYSGIITLSFTPYEDIITVSPIYLLGDATAAGWDNTLAIEMGYLDGGRFARVEYLDGENAEWFKFIADLGAWAPQWGTDETGTAEAGPLVYRPTEDVADPPSMPAPEVSGNYYIEADTALLTYKTFWSSGELYLVGSATTVGWDNTAALPFTEVEPHIFEITTTLAEGGMKFLEIVGEWAPQWGTDENATADGGRLVFRPDEATTDPPEIPSPGAGTFKIRADMTKISYTIEPQ